MYSAGPMGTIATKSFTLPLNLNTQWYVKAYVGIPDVRIYPKI